MFRTKSGAETADLALTFMEEEVGRFDWNANWTVLKNKGVARQKVADWLADLRVEHDPDAIVTYLDQMQQERSGRWL